MNSIAKFKKNPWSWIPTLYYTQGIPYVMVVTVSVIMYKDLGIDNAEIALYTSLLALPWAFKPVWSPLIDVFKTKRWWTYLMQGIIGVGFAGAAITLNTPYFFEASLVFLFIVAFCSSTHDIAADGFYMLALSEEDQSFFVGIRSTFFRLAMWSGEGLFVVLAGLIATSTGSASFSWISILAIVALLMFVMSAYHGFMLPAPADDHPVRVEGESPLKAVWETFVEFFKKDQIVLAILFILLYRFGEGQLVKLAAPFLMDTREAGGLALSVTEVGVINGIIGLLALTAGGILGGIVISRHGLKRWLWPMIIIMNLPNLAYWYLAKFQPESFITISTLVGVEKFGYGFGFAAFLMYLIYVAKGNHKTAHYAFGTALMAFGMSIPGAVSGYIQEAIGYEYFFLWVLASAIPIFILTPFINIDPDFGKKKDDTEPE
ncbi:MFS transporter [Gracilimonas tropica]|uniref:MFS transporter n=1 Tax=Gracilimonas tropica TaxID=454600 RepID=UPI00037C203E|nr:MFS transporter [Gracilimonas tropica]